MDPLFYPQSVYSLFEFEFWRQRGPTCNTSVKVKIRSKQRGAYRKAAGQLNADGRTACFFVRPEKDPGRGRGGPIGMLARARTMNRKGRQGERGRPVLWLDGDIFI